MTDEKSIEAPPENPDADRHALGDDILVRLDRDERLFATCGDPETARDCRDALAEILRLRMLLRTGAALEAETARRESAEALLRDRLSELPDGAWVAAEEHFSRYAPSGSGGSRSGGSTT